MGSPARPEKRPAEVKREPAPEPPRPTRRKPKEEKKKRSGASGAPNE